MGFSDCSVKDTMEYRNPKMAGVPTSRLERIIFCFRERRRYTTDRTDTSAFGKHLKLIEILVNYKVYLSSL